jgi:5'-nucleotidase (lipoprotein e(P4) family)
VQRLTMCVLLAVLSAVEQGYGATQEQIVQANRGVGLRPAEVSIRLERTPCFGSCPVYNVTLSGTGEVRYEGRQYVKQTGIHTSQLPQERVLRLVDRLLAARFLDANEEYVGSDHISASKDRLKLGRAFTSDADSVVLTLALGETRKTVRVVDSDPLGLREIADQIDSVVGIEQWIGTFCERPRAPIMGPLRPKECTGQTQVFESLAAKAPVGLEQLNAISWMQTAKEYPAITRAAYRRAIDQLPTLAASCTSAADEQPVSRGLCAQGKAIVMDIDETVLDNSAYFATLAVQQQTDAEGHIWEAWALAREAPAVPGAVEFIQAARSAGFHVVFVSNRECDIHQGYDQDGRAKRCPQLAATVDNLTSVLKAPVDPTDVYLRYAVYGRMDDEKSERRAQVAAKWRIAMLVGDDLRDFVRSDRYDPEQHDAHWSHDWIVLPNVIYGGWERSRSVAQKYADLQQWQPK